MSFRRRLLVVLAMTVFLAVALVSWVISIRTRRAFERADAERRQALVAQFQQEFARRGEEVVRTVDAITASDMASRMALDLSHGTEASVYVIEAKPIADSHQLDLLEFIGADGNIISSAQWPARFGYRSEVPPEALGKSAVLRLEPVPEGATLGLVAARAVKIGDKPLLIVGGERVDREFLSSLSMPSGMRVLLYRNFPTAPATGTGASEPAQPLIGAGGPLPNSEPLSGIIQRVKQTSAETDGVVSWSPDAADNENIHAMPLKDAGGVLLGVMLVGSSQRSLVELQRNIGAFALLAGGTGILAAILVSGWVAARVTGPIERLAEAAREVASGNWDAYVEVPSQDEVGHLAASFNRMTQELKQQRERTVQAERVAAWRELARRLAHELKNPLFPLQITVENLLRARNSQEFDEVFRESTTTLLAEISNLKTIIGRFNDFSKMPQPQLQAVKINDVVHQVISLHDAQFHVAGRPRVETHLELDDSLSTIDADPDLLHRALSNLVLNAMDAMPEGGTITVRTAARGDRACIEVSDTGSGLTRDECERLFTPYYTTKRHGTGLGLAIVQSVVADHHGTITVDSTPGKGTIFRIELPRSAPEAAGPAVFQSTGFS